MSRYMVELASSTGLVSSLNGRRAYWLKADPFAGDATALQAAPAPTPVRHVHRDRDFDFGVGYGNSSGYATDRHYVTEWGPRRFRCV